MTRLDWEYCVVAFGSVTLKWFGETSKPQLCLELYSLNTVVYSRSTVGAFID